MFQLEKLLKIKWGLGFDLKIVKNQNPKLWNKLQDFKH